MKPGQRVRHACSVNYARIKPEAYSHDVLFGSCIDLLFSCRQWHIQVFHQCKLRKQFMVCNQDRNQGGAGGAKPPLEKISPPLEKMCLTYFETIGHSLKNLSPSQKTLRPPWCPKLVTGLSVTHTRCIRYASLAKCTELVTCQDRAKSSQWSIPSCDSDWSV